MGLSFSSIPADDPSVVDAVRDYQQKMRGEGRYDTSKYPAWTDADVDAFIATDGARHAQVVDKMRRTGTITVGAAAALGVGGAAFCLMRTRNPAIGLVGGVMGAAAGFLVSGTALSSTADHKDVENVRNEFIDWHISKTAYDPKDRATLRGIKVPPPPKRWRGES